MQNLFFPLFGSTLFLHGRDDHFGGSKTLSASLTVLVSQLRVTSSLSYVVVPFDCTFSVRGAVARGIHSASDIITASSVCRQAVVAVE